MIQFVLQTPVDSVEEIFGYIIAFLQVMGLYNYFIGAFMGIIIIGLTLRLIDAIGGSK